MNNNNNEFFGDFDDLFNALNGNNNNAANNNNMGNNDPRMQMGGGNGNGGQGGRSLLDQYGTDLTALAKKGKIDPVIRLFCPNHIRTDILQNTPAGIVLLAIPVKV